MRHATIGSEDVDPAPDTVTPFPAMMLIGAVQAAWERSHRNLPEAFVRSLFEPANAPLHRELEQAVVDLEQRLPALSVGPRRAAALQSQVDLIARRLLASAERAFILDPERSTLDLLEPADRDRFLPFAWHANDFPGGPRGPNEDRAERMFASLARLRPERRANQGHDAAVRSDEFGDLQPQLSAALVQVPGENGQRLHGEASAAYVRTRAAAAADGVTLSIGNSYRSPDRAKAGAARADNPRAVATFSSHTLGLAVDLIMSQGGLRFIETSTRPFQNLVDMYRSPVHKWMFLRAETHGWFPYRREPWHWEYNPPGLRERIRASPRAAGPSATGAEAEGFSDPVAAPRRALSISGSVGRAGRNLAADVRAVQDRLVEVRALDPVDAAAERPASGTPAETALPRTIDAIETFQGRMASLVDGRVDVRGITRTDLDRAIAQPTASELAIIAGARDAVRLTVSRGLTLTGAVGATATGNAPDDVRAVQRRLAEIGRLAASHRETPPAGSTAVPQASLPATIAALRAFQADVAFWKGRGTIAGTITPGVIAPGDATASLLDRMSVYSMTVGATPISFHDHVVSRATRAEAGVIFAGTAPPGSIAIADYRALGLDPHQAAALKLVSTHEGNFDAVNTYDRALVSVGFIQFAGSRGLPRYLALLKARQPAKFQDLLQKAGIDVEFTVSHGAINAARVVVLDPASSTVLRGALAETAIRDDKTLTAWLLLSGRDRDVQLVQIEAAVRDYVQPALNGVVSWGPRVRARLGDLFRSQKGMASLFDRSIQEGLGAARRRFERIIQRLGGGDSGAAPPALAELQRREGDVLAELERDLQAATDVHASIARAREALEVLLRTASAAGATIGEISARPELASARRAVTDARTGLSAVINVTTPPNATVDATIAAMNTTLAAEESRLALTPAPVSTSALATTLSASRQALATAAAPVSTAPIFLPRIQHIRRSTLDSGLAEVS